MTSASQLPSGFFRVKPEHCPKTKEEKYQRVNFYTVQLGLKVSQLLTHALLELRKNAYRIQDQVVLKVALKAFTDQEYIAAIKEIMCVWLHLEAVDQEGETMPDWLLSFLRLGFNATDMLIPQPKAIEVLNAYGECNGLESLYKETALKTCRVLGFGEASPAFISFIYPILADANAIRQSVLRDALEKLPEEIVGVAFNI